jgi:hypothetical protein
VPVDVPEAGRLEPGGHRRSVVGGLVERGADDRRFELDGESVGQPVTEIEQAFARAVASAEIQVAGESQLAGLVLAVLVPGRTK